MTDTNNTDGAALLPVTLKPCPFCGGDAGLVGIRDGFMVACKSGKPCFARGPSAFHGPGGWDACRTDAIAAWNTRAPLPATQEDAERSGAGNVGWSPRIGEEVRVPDDFLYPEWRGKRLWISGLSVDHRYPNLGINATVSEQWPPEDATDGFYIGREHVPDDILPLSTPQRQEYDGEAVREALTTSPLIEAITPTNDEWEACDTVQDTYDLMKRRIRAALSSDKGEER